MIRIFYDFEFIDDGSTIEPLSLGMVSYDVDHTAISTLYLTRVMTPDVLARARQNPFLVEQVLPELENRQAARMSVPMSAFAPLVSLFVWDAVSATGVREPRREDVQLWAYYAAYDHVALSQLVGPMMRLPDHIPMHTCDLRQEMDRLGVTREQLPFNTDEHNALADARWCAEAFQSMILVMGAG